MVGCPYELIRDIDDRKDRQWLKRRHLSMYGKSAWFWQKRRYVIHAYLIFEFWILCALCYVSRILHAGHMQGNKNLLRFILIISINKNEYVDPKKNKRKNCNLIYSRPSHSFWPVLHVGLRTVLSPRGSTSRYQIFNIFY